MAEVAINSIERIERENLMNNDRITCDLDKNITMEDRAPEGGWGWIVMLAMIIILITIIGPAPSTGLIFGSFLETTGQVSLFLMLFGAVFSVTYSISSSLANYLMKKYTMRPVAVIAAILFSVSNILLAFATNIEQMLILFLIQGIGVGLLLTLSNTNFNSYFVKKRARIMSLAQVIIGMGAIFYPYFIDKMMPMYGFRGTASIIGAISLNCIPAVLMLHPVEWHAKDPEKVLAERVREAEKKSRRLAILNRNSTTDVHHEDSSADWISLRNLKEDSTRKDPLLTNTSKAEPTEEISNSESGRVRSWSWSTREALNERLCVFSTSSLTNLAGGIGALADIRSNPNLLGNKMSDKTSPKKENTSLFKKIIEIFDLSMMKDRYFMNLTLGSSIAVTCDFTFVSILPIMMIHNGYTRSESALAIMVSGIAELIFRILLAIFNFFIKVKAKYMFFIAMIAMSFAKAGFVVFENTLTAVLIMNAIIGMVRSLMLVPQSLVIIENVEIENLTSAYGCFGFVMGCTSLLLGPTLGQLRDWTGSYKIFQYVSLGINTICIFPWALQFILVDFQKWREATRTNNLN